MKSVQKCEVCDKSHLLQEPSQTRDTTAFPEGYTIQVSCVFMATPKQARLAYLESVG